MMKRIILLLMAMLIWTPVYAQEYTDYEFVGYTTEQKENDEFYKYEQTKLNKFYKLVETNVEYVREDYPYTQKYIDMEDQKMGELISSNRNLPYEDKTHALTVKTDENYFTKTVRIENLTNFKKIEKIEIWSKDTLIKTVLKEGISNNTFEIQFENNTLDDLIIKFHYKTDTDINLNVSFINETGYKMFSKKITLEKLYERFTLNALCNKDFDDYIEKYLLMGKEESYYYRYKVEIYRVYDLEKEYYKDLENTSLEGYQYDDTESYLAYRVFKREKLPNKEPDVEAIDPTPPKEPIDDPNVGTDEPNDNKGSATTDIPKNDKPAITTTKKKKSTTTKKSQNNVVNNQKNDDEIAEKTTAKPYETVDNMSKTNLTEYKSKENTMSCDCKPKVNHFTILGLLMLIVSLIITGIHYYNVNRDNFN